MGRLFYLLISLLPFLAFGQKDVNVNGYFRNDGTYVQPHMRSAPDHNPYNNWSYPGNVNPYTGKVATGNPDTYLYNYYNRSAPGGATFGRDASRYSGVYHGDYYQGKTSGMPGVYPPSLIIVFVGLSPKSAVTLYDEQGIKYGQTRPVGDGVIELYNDYGRMFGLAVVDDSRNYDIYDTEQRLVYQVRLPSNYAPSMWNYANQKRINPVTAWTIGGVTAVVALLTLMVIKTSK